MQHRSHFTTEVEKVAQRCFSLSKPSNCTSLQVSNPIKKYGFCGAGKVALGPVAESRSLGNVHTVCQASGHGEVEIGSP